MWIAASVLTLLSLATAGSAIAGSGGSTTSAPAEKVTKLTSEAPAGDKVFPYEMKQKTLANGLQVVVVPMPADGLVSYRTVVRTGARDEYEKGHTGFAHFFEHMMFRGTEKYPADKYGELVTKMGADSNAYTSTDITVYQFDIAAEDLDTVMEIESDRFMNLSYSEAVFQTEAGAVYGEYRKNKASPGFVLYEASKKAAFSKHTYGHTAMGYVEDIQAMPKMYDYSKRFFQRYYRPENCTVIVAGDVDAEQVFAKAESYYGTWKKGYKKPKIKAEPKQRREKRIDVAYEGQTLPMISIGYKGDAFDAKDKTWAASILLADLAFGETSKIHKELVLEKQLVQFISASPAMDRDPGLWGIWTMVNDAKDIDTVLGRIDEAVAWYQANPVPAQRLTRVKSAMKYGYLMGLDTPASVAGSLASTIGVTGDPGTDDVLYATLAAVTPEDIQAAAKKYLRAKQRTVAVLQSKPAPEAKKDEAKK
jgi:zinc protease